MLPRYRDRLKTIFCALEGLREVCQYQGRDGANDHFFGTLEGKYNTPSTLLFQDGNCPPHTHTPAQDGNNTPFHKNENCPPQDDSTPLAPPQVMTASTRWLS